MTPNEVAKILSSPLQGLRFFLSGAQSPDEKRPNRKKSLMTREFTSPTGELVLENPAASDRVPLLLGSETDPLLQEEGKVSSVKSHKSSFSSGGVSPWSSWAAKLSSTGKCQQQHGCWFFVCLFVLAGMAYSTSLIVGNIAHDLIKMEMEEVQNKRVVLSSLVGVAAGTGGTAMSVKHFAKSPVCTLVCSASFALGGLVPIAPFALNAFVMGFSLNLAHQTVCMAVTVAILIFACGTYLEVVLQSQNPGLSACALRPVLKGLRHLFYSAVMTGVTLCLGSGINYNWNL